MMTTNNLGWVKAVGYVLIYVVLQLIVLSIASIGYSLYIGHEVEELPTMGMMIVMALSPIIGIALFMGAGWTKVSRQYLQSRPVGVLFWCALAALGAIIPSMFLQELMPEWPDSIQKYIEQTEISAARLMSTTGGYFVICLLAPVAEEVVFRGAVLRTLLAWKPERRWLMITFSALLFAAAHLNPAQLLHPLLIGLLLGWMYERTGSLLPGIIYHWVNNTAAYLLFRAYPSPDIKLIDIFGGQPTKELLAVVFSLFILMPALYQLFLRMKK